MDEIIYGLDGAGYVTVLFLVTKSHCESIVRP